MKYKLQDEWIEELQELHSRFGCWIYTDEEDHPQEDLGILYWDLRRLTIKIRSESPDLSPVVHELQSALNFFDRHLNEAGVGYVAAALGAMLLEATDA